MEPMEVLVVAVIGVAVVATVILTSFQRVQRQLDMNKQSLVMLRHFCFLEAILVALAFKWLSYPAFVVLHQLLLAYPSNILFNIVATMCMSQETDHPPQDYDHPPLHEERCILLKDCMFLKEVEEEHKQILAHLNRINELLVEYNESVIWCQLPVHFQHPIHNMNPQIEQIRQQILDLSVDLECNRISVGSSNVGNGC
jgi:hypothetical protein